MQICTMVEVVQAILSFTKSCMGQTCQKKKYQKLSNCFRRWCLIGFSSLLLHFEKEENDLIADSVRDGIEFSKQSRL